MVVDIEAPAPERQQQQQVEGASAAAGGAAAGGTSAAGRGTTAAAGGAAAAGGGTSAAAGVGAAADQSRTAPVDPARILQLLRNQRGYSYHESEAMQLLLGQKLLEGVSPRDIKRLLNRYRLAKYIMLEQVCLVFVMCATLRVSLKSPRSNFYVG